MARVTDGVLPDDLILGLTLDRYQEIMRLPIAAFNGLNKPDEIPQFQCSTVWKQDDRDYLAEHLAVAEEMREVELQYAISPKYFLEDTYECANPVVLNRKHLVKIGTQKTTDVALSVALTLGNEATPNDPVIVVIATTVTETSEIKAFYPGEDVEIHSSNISISGGNVTIKIPRSRLVDPALLDNREDHLSYYENDNFIATIDVKRVWYDITDAVYFVCDAGNCACGSLAETAQLAFPKITDYRRAIVKVIPAIYDITTGLWSTKSFSSCCCCNPYAIRLNYVAGRRSSMITELLTARLAHSTMPNKPVSCPTVHMYWQEDIMPSKSVTPYGSTMGALNAWVADARQKVGQGGKFPSMRKCC